MPSEKCTNCAKPSKAETYCVECKKSYCRFCLVLIHHPETAFEKHSIEEIAPFQGVKIITPILLDVFVLSLAVFLLGGAGITEDYFKGSNYCPALTHVRRKLATFDPNLFFYYKAHLSKFCDHEDSYWRFFMDAWVRAILTGTDTWLLVLSELWSAILFEEVIRILVTPVISVAYSTVATLVSFLEKQLFGFVYQELGAKYQWNKTTQFFDLVEETVESLSLAKNLDVSSKLKLPPPTLPRKLPMKDWLEYGRYMLDRRMRVHTHFRVQAQNACNFVLRGTLGGAVIVRIACILFGSFARDVFVGAAKLVGLDALAGQHRAWFMESTGIIENSQNNYYSDWLLSTGVEKLFSHSSVAALQRLRQLVGEVGDKVVGENKAVVFPLMLRLIMALLVFLAPPILFYLKIRHQRQRFDSDWTAKDKPSTRKYIWGEMSKESPCQDWKCLWMSREDKLSKPKRADLPAGSLATRWFKWMKE